MDVWFHTLCYDIECPHATVTRERASPDTSQCGEELTAQRARDTCASGYTLFVLWESLYARILKLKLSKFKFNNVPKAEILLRTYFFVFMENKIH